MSRYIALSEGHWYEHIYTGIWISIKFQLVVLSSAHFFIELDYEFHKKKYVFFAINFASCLILSGWLVDVDFQHAEDSLRFISNMSLL